MSPELQTIIEAVNMLGLWAVFAILFWDERKAHRATRDDLTQRLQQAQADHMEDLKEIAGMRQSLGAVQRIVTNYRAGDNPEAAPRPKV